MVSISLLMTGKDKFRFVALTVTGTMNLAQVMLDVDADALEARGEARVVRPRAKNAVMERKLGRAGLCILLAGGRTFLLVIVDRV